MSGESVKINPLLHLPFVVDCACFSDDYVRDAACVGIFLFVMVGCLDVCDVVSVCH